MNVAKPWQICHRSASRREPMRSRPMNNDLQEWCSMPAEWSVWNSRLCRVFEKIEFQTIGFSARMEIALQPNMPAELSMVANLSVLSDHSLTTSSPLPY